MSFGVGIFHHYNSRSSAENLELIILTQDYLKLASVSAENVVDHTYEVTNNTGTIVLKVGNFTHPFNHISTDNFQMKRIRWKRRKFSDIFRYLSEG